MKEYVVLLCLLCAAILIVGVFCISPQRRAQEAYHRGITDLASGLNSDAVADFSRAIELNPRLAPAYLGRAEARFGLIDVTNAVTDCNAVLDLDPTNERAFFIRGTAALYLHDFNHAISDLGKAISLNSNDQEACFYRGIALLQTRDWEGSKADLTKAIQLNPYNAKACLYRAQAEMKLKEYENAIMDASNAIPLDAATAAGAYCLRAHARARLKDRAGAFADVNQAINLRPNDPSGYAMRATCDIIWDDFSSASNDIETLTRLRPPPAKTILLCRAMLEQKCRQPAAAIADYRQAFARSFTPVEAPEFHEAIGHLDEDLSQWPQALKEFQEGMDAKFPPEQMRFELFLTECRLGQTSQAQSELNAYLQSIPSSKTNEWTTSIAHFLAGNLDETNFLAQATATAKRPTDIPGQTCDAYYYEGMRQLLAGNKTAALTRLQQSVDTGEDDSFEYMSARDEVDALKNP